MLATTYTVDTLADVSDGNFSPGRLSLREAIERANLDVAQDEIRFAGIAFPNTLFLNGAQLLITKDLIIRGPGANLLTIDGNNLTRIFQIGTNTADDPRVELIGMTLAHANSVGEPTFDGQGGAILLTGDLVLSKMALMANQAFDGGAVYMFNNVVGDTDLAMMNSTIGNNVAADDAGGINLHFLAGQPGGGDVQIINSTISGNTANDEGGGIRALGGIWTIVNTTIIGNSADFNGATEDDSSLGGGIHISNPNATVTLLNTIVAGNTTGFNNPPFSFPSANDINGTVVVAASGHNVIGDSTSAGGLANGNNGNIVSVNPNSLMERQLRNNGGPTLTHALRSGSVALDAGDNALVELPTDQRGITRIVDGPDAGTTATVDIGAYEAKPRTLVVNTLANEIDLDYGPGDFSLREALERANANAGADVVNFASGLTGTVYTAGSALYIVDSVVINGPGADRLTIDGGGSGGNGILRISSAGSVAISGMAITRGYAVTGGGGIYVEGSNLTLNRMYIHDNVTSLSGGGISVWGDTTVTIFNSTIANNRATAGAGILLGNSGDSPSVLVINSTVSGNVAGNGAGLYVALGSVILRNSSITGNRADIGGAGTYDGGGIYTSNDAAASTTLFNTIVADNRRGAMGSEAPNDIAGKNVEAGSANNLIGNAATAGGLTPGTSANIVGNNGSGVLDINTVLDTTLQDNFGPTPTHRLVAGSPAIDAGNNVLAVDQNGLALAFDQRGAARIVDRDGNGTVTVDIGAVERHLFTLGLSGTITYTENGDPLILAPGAALPAVDNPAFDTGNLTVSNAVGPHTDDRLIVRHQGIAASQVSASGANVSYGGLLIGTKSGGSGATPLVVTFNANATAEAVQAVVRRIAFSSISNSPPTAARSIRFVATDGQGNISNTATKTVQVVRIKDLPVIGNFGGAVNYIEDTTAVGVAVSATVSDADSFNFDTGKLSARLSANAQSSDRLSLRALGGVSTNGSEVIVSGQVVGTFSGGSGSTALVVTFNANATAARVQAVLQAVAFQNTSQAPANAVRTLSVFVTDGDGGTSITATKSISVKPVNDRPVLGGISGSVGYVRNAAAFMLAPSAAVTDVDSANFDGGRLRVRNSTGVSSSNRLAIGAGFTVDANNNVRQGSTIIGKRTANGFGTNELVVVFNANATEAIVQQLVRAITFKTVGGAAGARKVMFTVSDGDGRLSAEATKTVNVT